MPEDCRAALYNLFRVPLNVIVLGVLLSDMAVSVAFTWSSGFLLCGAALQVRRHVAKTAWTQRDCQCLFCVRCFSR